MRRSWMFFRRNRQVGHRTKNMTRSQDHTKASHNHPIMTQDFVERPFLDTDLASWDLSKRTNGKGLMLVRNTEDPESSKKNLNNSFHYSLAPAFLLAEIIGLFPVSGVRSKDSNNVRFIWCCWKTLYTFLNLAIGVSICSLSIYRMCLDGIDLNKAGAFVFYLTVTVNLILFIQLSLEWEEVVREVTTTEIACPFDLYSPKRYSLKTRLTIIAYTVMLISSVEHGWSNFSVLTSAYACITDQPVIYDFYTQSYPQIFRVMPYRIWVGLLMQIWNAIATAIWNFSDVFLILISYSIIHRFNRLSDWLDMTDGQRVSEQFWKSVRTEYIRLSLMVKRLDRAVNCIMSLSFASNLYIICEQMFNSLKEKNFNESQTECERRKNDMVWPAVIDIVYFTFSFSYLIVRFLGVAMVAAQVYTSARRPKDLLHCVPTYNYCTEVQRFLDQVSTDRIALTGKNLFSITRSLILKIAGTIITYELVLVQFYSTSSYVQSSSAEIGLLRTANTSTPNQ